MNIVKNHYVDFSGRASRKEYWTYFLVYILLYIALSILSFILTSISSSLAIVGTILIMIFSLGLFLPTLGIAWRRVQDTGKPGWFALIPIYGFILLLMEGTAGANEYGPDPKAA